ncbi:hypothetical protein RRG08_045650 [Elysia crispata]|uniref:Uncharacterized protein n=1 Tax=Elysia crispata TaxID=231223 RepID=A0AAE0ZUV1_9GAST|nr:hypothetical protein RRG08_045650 [Elysia crispata]
MILESPLCDPHRMPHTAMTYFHAVRYGLIQEVIFVRIPKRMQYFFLLIVFVPLRSGANEATLQLAGKTSNPDSLIKEPNVFDMTRPLRHT